jgi:hypothetical protein
MAAQVGVTNPRGRGRGPLQEEPVADAPCLWEERVVAASPSGPPEYQLRAVLRRQFDADSPALWLRVEGPFSGKAEYWDSRHVELMLELLRRALPVLRSAEERVDADWRDWLEGIEAPRGSEP